MKRFKIEDLFEVSDAMYSDIIEGIEETEFIGYYSDVSMVLKYLLTFDETMPCFIHIADAESDIDVDDYEKEYSIILDSDMNIWCEKAYKDGRYLFVSSERVYIADDCNPELLDCIDMDVEEVYEVTYGLEPEKEREKDCPKKDSQEIVTRVAKDKDGKVQGFEKSWDSFEDGMYYRTTYSFFSSNQDMLKNTLENFEVKY